MTVSDAFKLYMFEEVKLKGGASKTMRNYQTVLNSFLASSPDIPVEIVDHQVIVRWKMQMDSVGKQSSTVSGELGKLRQVFKYLRRHNYKVMDYRDIDLPRVYQKEATYLDPEEIIQMLSQTENLRDKLLIRMLFACGGRISEVLSLDRDSIVNAKAQVLGKGSKLITLRFDPNTLKALDEYLATRKDKLPPIFLSGQYRRLTVSRAEQILHVIAGESGITKNVTPHVFRHSFATDLLVNGAELSEVQQQLNHSNISTTMIYTHHSQGRKDEAYTSRHTVI